MSSSKKKTAQQQKGRNVSRLSRDVWGIIFLFLSLFTFLSLISFNHLDPSVFSRTSRIAANFGGRVGANLAEALIQAAGFGSFFITAMFFTLALKFFQGAKGIHLAGNAICQVIALIAASTLLSLEIGDIHYGGLALSCGGLIGAALSQALRHYLNLWGATLFMMCTLLIAIVFATPISANTMAKALRVVSRALWAAALIGGKRLKQFLQTAFRYQRQQRDQRAEELEAKLAGPSKETIKTAKKKEAPAIVVGGDVDLEDFDSEGVDALEAIEVAEITPPARRKNKQMDLDENLTDEIFIEEPLHLRAKKNAKNGVAMKPLKSVASGIGGLIGNWRLPDLEFLKEAPVIEHKLNREDLINNSKNLEAKLAEFGIKGQVVAVRPGPVITMYEFKPGAGVKISQIASRADDLSLALEAQSVRIVAPIPGKSVVGIELPNEKRETVFLRELLAADEFQNNSHAIPLVVGKDIAGAPVITDIAATPHLLVAGSSGAGKSVFINTLITSLLYKFTPQDMRLIMVDPKQLELALYEKIPHLLLPVVDDPQKASTALRWACNEMERRYTLMARAGVRNLKGFNQKLANDGQDKMRDMLCPLNEDGTAKTNNIAHLLDHDEQGKPKVEHLPFILVIIDEFADLMMVAKKDIETNVARLAAKARASGIHLVIATQRPSTDVITGVIKNNLPSRVAFKVPSQIDSRTILDGMGAEKLLGKGDMLFIPPGMSRLVRVHGAYIDEEEIGKICDFWRSQGEPVYKEEILEEPDILDDDGDGDGVADPLYHQAVSLVREEGMASASRLQRRLKVGYNRAARMIESMEAQGLVGPGSGSKPREVIY